MSSRDTVSVVSVGLTATAAVDDDIDGREFRFSCCLCFVTAADSESAAIVLFCSIMLRRDFFIAGFGDDFSRFDFDFAFLLLLFRRRRCFDDFFRRRDVVVRLSSLADDEDASSDELLLDSFDFRFRFFEESATAAGFGFVFRGSGDEAISPGSYTPGFISF